MSASRVFLKPVMNRSNLTVVTSAHAHKVNFVDSRAVSIDCDVGGSPTTFQCRREIILSAGALLSPKLLQLSGIGPAGLLNSLGIDIIHDSPDVGRKLREHLGFSMPHRLKNGKGINHRLRGAGLVASVLQYYLTHNGIHLSRLNFKSRHTSAMS